MKILMTKSWEAPEYLDDSMLHGLRSLFGDNVIDYPRMWHMYANSFGPGKIDISTICARGFTFYGRMTDESVDRTDLISKIKNQYFDLIVMHSWYPNDLTPVVIEHVPAQKIVWLDGRDEREILTQYIGTGHYFKRELIDSRTDVHPIGFAFPRENIQLPQNKIHSLSPLIPGQTHTYIYYDEASYYTQYNQSLFAVTHAKGGWDCLRHYEILGSRSIPWFIDIDFCPPRTCTSLPKKQLSYVNGLISTHGHESFMNANRALYEDLSADILNHFDNNCLTDHLARYLLDTVKKHS